MVTDTCGMKNNNKKGARTKRRDDNGKKQNETDALNFMNCSSRDITT